MYIHTHSSIEPIDSPKWKTFLPRVKKYYFQPALKATLDLLFEYEKEKDMKNY